eukprot:maker-scaffold408_size180710-snap-gene-0.39 protein:Tk05216 transcript:maker-scaffold408_size180710-snap-gene-0.39-mRNA-1 annotation:"hypothetical protein AaeL_AAEL004515"
MTKYEMERNQTHSSIAQPRKSGSGWLQSRSNCEKVEGGSLDWWLVVFIVRAGWTSEKRNNAYSFPKHTMEIHDKGWHFSSWTSKSRLTAIAVFIVLYFCLIQQSSAIKCWVCRSDGDPKCADPFDNTSFPITDCKQEKPREHLPGLESTMCRKVRQKVNGNWRYLRSCAWLGEPGIGRDERYCIHRSGTYNIHVEYCTCRCWVCSSDISRRDGHPDCRDPFDNRSFPITNCQDETPTEELTGLETAMCRKVRQKGSAIKCWVCHSDVDPDCGDPFDNRSIPITNCQDETPTEELTGLETAMCRKVRQKVDGNWRILRTCAWLVESDDKQDEGHDNDQDEGHDNDGSEADDIHEEYYHCMSKDGCNGADSAKPVFFLMTLFPFLAITRNAL